MLANSRVMTLLFDQLLEKLKTRRARVGVVGLGYVGPPLLVEFGRGGSRDRHRPDLRKVAAIGMASPTFRTFLERSADLVAAGRLDAND